MGATTFKEMTSSFLKKLGIQYLVTDKPEIGGIGKKDVEDFIVEEILPDGQILDATTSWRVPHPGGLYTWFILEKQKIDSFGAIRVIAKELQRPLKDFEYAGLKDAFGITRQAVSVWNVPPEDLLKLNESVWDIKIISPQRSRFPNKLGNLWGNHFKIWIRDCPHPPEVIHERVIKIWEDIKQLGGILSYFDLQRFGSGRPITHEVGKLLFHQQWEEAFWMYLSIPTPVEPEGLSEVRKKLGEGELSFEEALNELPNTYRVERELCLYLKEHPSNPNKFFNAWKHLSPDLLTIFCSAYQSYLYNHLLSRVVKQLGYPDILECQELPIIGSHFKRKWHSKEVMEIIQELMDEENAYPKLFRRHPLRAFRTKGSGRKTIAIVKDFTHETVYNEETQATDVYMEFSLQRGAYAVTVMREFIQKPIPFNLFYNKDKQQRFLQSFTDTASNATL